MKTIRCALEIASKRVQQDTFVPIEMGEIAWRLYHSLDGRLLDICLLRLLSYILV